MWWPRRGVGPRQRLRDLHAVVGAYALPVLLALTASGLAWTRWTGERRWHPLAEDAVHDTWTSPPRSTATGGPRLDVDHALAAADLVPGATGARAVYVAPPTSADGAYALLAYDEDFGAPWRAESVWIDAFDGRTLARLGWADRSLAGKVDSALYGVHVGAILGLPGRIAACVAALVLAGLCLTGPWMWWKRRPRGGLGVPPAVPGRSWPMLAGAVVVGWLLPMVGVTLVVVVVVELGAWLVRRGRGTVAGRGVP